MPGYHWLPDRLKVGAQTRRGLADATGRFAWLARNPRQAD